MEQALRLGYLKPGDQLPKVRDVVGSLAINPNTGQGTFIEATLRQVALPELVELRSSLLGWLASAESAGLDVDGTEALFANVLRDFHQRPGKASREPRGVAGEEAEGVA